MEAPVEFSTLEVSRVPAQDMTEEKRHISVCVCTYKRPEFLKRLLEKLGDQDTGGLFTYSIVVADNDHLRSAEPVVSDFMAASPVCVTYCTEPRQNIALARNKAVENAQGDFVAFIDDDEFPVKHWLLTLYKTCEEYGVDGVLGPVKRHFDQEPPTWIMKGNFYQHTTYPTGTLVEWSKGRTGNLLLTRNVIAPGEQLFRPEFRAGEDQDYFRRMIEKGYLFVWCKEAVAYEVVPPVRWKRRVMLRRALLMGVCTVVHPTFRVRDLAKSLIAVPAYTCILPFSLVLGHHTFMTLLIKLFHHLGKLLGLLRVNPVKAPYVTE